MKKIENRTNAASLAALEARDGCEEAENNTIKLHAETEHFAKQAEIFRNDTEGFKGEADNFATLAFISEKNTQVLHCAVKDMLHEMNSTRPSCSAGKKRGKREIENQYNDFNDQLATSRGDKPTSLINTAFDVIFNSVKGVVQGIIKFIPSLHSETEDPTSHQTLKTGIFSNCTKEQLEETKQQISNEVGKLLQEVNKVRQFIESRQSTKVIGRTHQTADTHIGTYISNVQISCHITAQLAGTYP